MCIRDRAAVLQLGVTLDYSIFLMHSYEEQQARYNGDKERAMAHAISQTFSSVIGSSVTTVAGFIALCFMTFTLGMDIGVVMVKGVVPVSYTHLSISGIGDDTHIQRHGGTDACQNDGNDQKEDPSGKTSGKRIRISCPKIRDHTGKYIQEPGENQA